MKDWTINLRDVRKLYEWFSYSVYLSETAQMGDLDVARDRRTQAIGRI